MKLNLYLASLASLALTAIAAPLDGQPNVVLERDEECEKKLGARAAPPLFTIIRHCTEPGTVALTFDDGPNTNTGTLLELLENNTDIKVTFFVNGQNFGSINEPANQDRIRRMIAGGHQIGSHTWSHPFLTSLDRAGIVSQMDQLSDALRGIIGRAPKYMRPPYFDVNDFVVQTMGELGFYVIHADIDTLDYANQSEEAIENSVQRFKDGLDQGGNLALAHDVHFWTVTRLASAMIDEVRARGLRAVTVGECLGDPESGWYF